MDARAVHFAVALLLSIFFGQGEAQVGCYQHPMCNLPSVLFTDVTPQLCCMQEDSVAFQKPGDGEVCNQCLVYGWLDNFPIEVTKGQMLTLRVGYRKGSPSFRRIVTVDFDSDEVDVSITRIGLIVTGTDVQVNVSDDGQPVTEDISIIITLEYDNVGSDEIFLDIAELVIRGQTQEKPVKVELTASEIAVAESNGSISVCVSATDIGSREIVVSLMAAPGTADDDDFSFPTTTLKMNSTLTRTCVDVVMIMDGLYEYSESFTILLSTSEDNVNITNNATEIRILDADEAVIVVTPQSQEVVEGDVETRRVCLSLNNSEVSVNVTLSGGNQFEGDVDLRLQQQFTILHPNGIPVCFEYVVVDDDEVEEVETVEWTWVGVDSFRVQSATFHLTIRDNDEPLPPPDLPPDDTLADVVTGGALLTALINARSKDLDSPLDMSLCYEIHGNPGTYFNYISGHCLSVNTHYIISNPSKPLNNIDEIDVVVTNSAGAHVNMSIDTECRVRGNGSSVVQYINSSGLVVQASSDTVVISTDNAFCGGQQMAIVVYCSSSSRYGLMQLHVHRDLVVSNNYHGLLGQFWGRSILIERYGPVPEDYLIEIPLAGSQTRRLVGSDHSITWQLRKQRCLYAGDRQGAKGAGLHGGPNEPVIDGVYTDYITGGPFDTSFEFSQFGQ